MPLLPGFLLVVGLLVGSSLLENNPLQNFFLVAAMGVTLWTAFSLPIPPRRDPHPLDEALLPPQENPGPVDKPKGSRKASNKTGSKTKSKSRKV